MAPKNAVALGIVLVLITTIFLPMLSTSVISDSKDSKTVSISVIPSTKTAKARSPGYAVYNLTVNTTVGISYIAFEAGNASVWTVEFLNESGVPLPTTLSGKPEISNPTAGIKYYVLTKVKVPSSTTNSTQVNQTIYANGSDGNKATAVLTTICDTFSTPAPYGVIGTAKYPGAGDAADGALVLLINTVTGETSYDTVGTTGASNMSGYYSTDTSQMPSGCTNNTWLQVIASNTTGNKYGTLKVQMNNATAYQWANVTLNITTGGGLPPTSWPSNAKAAASGSGIVVSWDAVGDATGYNIYRSTKVNGTGFDFGTQYTTVDAVTSWNDTGALSNTSNYSYVVKSKNAFGENPTASNIAFKLRYRLYTTGIAGGGDNLIALPYGVNITNTGGTNTSRALRQGIIDAGGTGVTVARWNQSTGGWDTQTALGTKFVLNASESYKVYLTNEIWYPLVGSYKSTTISLYTTGIAGGGDNLICLPYNANITNAGGNGTSRALRQAIIDAGGTGVTVARWNQSTGGWDTQTALGTKFVLKAGEGYKVYLTNSITWTCPVRESTA